MKTSPLTRDYRAEPQQAMFSMFFQALNRAAQRFDLMVRQPEPAMNRGSVGGAGAPTRATRLPRRRFLV